MVTLKTSELFQIADSDSSTDYILKAVILSQDQPALGFDMTVTLLTKYYLYDGLLRTQVWSQEIYSKYTASFGSCLVGSIRLNKANEGAIRENLGSFLIAVSHLRL